MISTPTTIAPRFAALRPVTMQALDYDGAMFFGSEAWGSWQ